MNRGWILLILIPIAALATVFAWSIDSLAGIVALALGLIIIILTILYIIWSSQKADKDPLAEKLRRLQEHEGEISISEVEMSIPLRDRIVGTVRDLLFDKKDTDTPQGNNLSGQQGKGHLDEDGKSMPAPPPEPEPATPEFEEDDEIEFSDVDDEVSVDKPKPDSKPQAPPAPAPIAPGRSLDVSDKEDEDLFGEEEDVDISIQYGGKLFPPEEVIDERKESKKEDVEDTETQVKETQFTAYYARQSAAKTEYGFYVYAHLPDALISADIQQFTADLGGRIPKPVVAKQTATLHEGALLTAMIHCDALEFNQIGIMKKWEAPFVRFDFRYTAPEALIDEFVEGRVAIMLGMIEIASIDFQIGVTAPQAITLINTLPDDPLQQSHFEPTNPSSMYQTIFISYSRKDSFVAEEFRKAQIMMGNIVFMDTHTIRAGEAWEDALKRFIREADVFQLFWSEHSASSDHCRFEWEYALNQRCSETRCVGFIRPTYWEKPLPPPPSELGHLHFAYVPQEGVLQ